MFIWSRRTLMLKRAKQQWLELLEPLYSTHSCSKSLCSSVLRIQPAPNRLYSDVWLSYTFGIGFEIWLYIYIYPVPLYVSRYSLALFLSSLFKLKYVVTDPANLRTSHIFDSFSSSVYMHLWALLLFFSSRFWQWLKWSHMRISQKQAYEPFWVLTL